MKATWLCKLYFSQHQGGWPKADELDDQPANAFRFSVRAGIRIISARGSDVRSTEQRPSLPDQASSKATWQPRVMIFNTNKQPTWQSPAACERDPHIFCASPLTSDRAGLAVPLRSRAATVSWTLSWEYCVDIGSANGLTSPEMGFQAPKSRPAKFGPWSQAE